MQCTHTEVVSLKTGWRGVSWISAVPNYPRRAVSGGEEGARSLIKKTWHSSFSQHSENWRLLPQKTPRVHYSRCSSGNHTHRFLRSHPPHFPSSPTHPPPVTGNFSSTNRFCSSLTRSCNSRSVSRNATCFWSSTQTSRTVTPHKQPDFFCSRWEHK